MRPHQIALPIALLLAGAGGLLAVKAKQPPPVRIQEAGGIPLLPKEDHPVTPEMAAAVERKATEMAPELEGVSTRDDRIAIAPRDGDRPQFVYFVLHGCPCSFEVEPLFKRLYLHFEGEVQFVSVTDADLEGAKKWSDQMLVPYPVIPDPGKRIIRAFNAKNSVYSALISRDGRIVKMWPGYSRDILLEMNELMAKELGLEPDSFDPQYAPLEEKSGCVF
jgi:peroxiredoxin